jgi:catechol 2,3-dioxygenase-like lactoylglutathione lyase family enzyme
MSLRDFTVEAVVAVSDVDRARRFYENGLGLVAGHEEEQAVRYPCADGTSIFIYRSPDNAGKSPATVAGWFVDDLDETMDQLTARGVEFERYDQPGLTTDARGVFVGDNFRAAWVTDPDGNTLAISEVGS